MTRKCMIVAVAGGCLALGGCGADRGATRASMGVMRPDAAVLTLGAGDALGRSVYVNDLIIAAREVQGDVAITSVPETGSFDLND